MATKELKLVGWGYEGDEITDVERQMVTSRMRERFGGEFEIRKAPGESAIELDMPRLSVPPELSAFATSSKRDRLLHTYGKSYPDYARQFLGDYRNAPDIVAYARSEADLAAVFEYAMRANAAVIPFGGGTSVCGGVEPVVGSTFNGTISLDLTRLDRILEVDKTSRAARIQGGIRVPAMENELKSHGLTLRHFPQSMELATLGGMIATRSGGHFALYPHRRSRRKLEDSIAGRRDGEPPPAGFRRRPEPRSIDDRLGRIARNHHRSVDAPAGATDVPSGDGRYVRRCLQGS